LYLTYDGLTGPIGRSQILPFLCNLSQKGIHIQVLSLEDEYLYKKGKKRIEDIVNNLDIEWNVLTSSYKIPVFSLFRNQNRMKSFAKRLYKTTSFDVVHCRSFPAVNTGLYLKKHYKSKVLFDMRVFYADDLANNNIWKLKNPIYHLMYCYFKQREKDIFPLSDYIVTKTEASKTILLQDYHVDVPVSVIPSCVDFNLFDRNSILQEDKKELRQKLGIAEDDFVIAYIGSLGCCYLIDEMMDFVGELLKVKPQTKFLVITPDSEQLVVQSARKKGVDMQHIIVDFAIRNQMPLYISIIDVSIFFIKPVFSKKASSPKKMGEVLSLGIPVITNMGVGDVDTIVKDSKFGLLVEDFSTKSYQHVIALMDDLLKTDPNVCIDAAKSCFSLEKGVDEYSNIYRLLTKT
jgi:glycogen synthase